MTTKNTKVKKEANPLRPFRIYYIIKEVGEVYFGTKPRLRKKDTLFFSGLLIPNFVNNDQKTIHYSLIPDDMPATVDMNLEEKREYNKRNFEVLVPHINLRLSVYLQRPTITKWKTDDQ